MASGGHNIVFYDTSSYKPLCEYGSFAEPVHSIDWSYDSKYLLVIPSTGCCEILRPYSSEAKVLQSIKIQGVKSAVFYKNTHRFICMGFSNGDVQIWDTKKQEISKTMVSTHSNVNCIDISYNDNYMSVGCEDGHINLYGLTTNKRMQSLTINSTSWPITSLKYSSREHGMFGATNDHGFVAIWDVVKRKNHLFIAKNHSSIASGIALSPINTNFFVSVGYDHLICMCDLRTKQSVCNRESPYALTSVDMSSDGIMMMCGHRKGGILIYDLRNNKEPLLNISGHTGVVTSVAFQHAVRDKNKEKGHETSIEQNLSLDNRSIEKVSTSDEQQDDSFLNLLDDMKENIYISPNILQTPAKCEIDTFMKDLTSPKVSEPNLLLKNLTPKECQNLKSPNIISNEYLSPLTSINYETSSRNEIFKSTPVLEVQKNEETKEYSNREVTNVDYLVFKNEVEDMKKQMMQMIEMHKSSMLRLHMLLCTQHIELMNKLDNGSITTDTMQLKKEIKRLQDENQILSYENGIMRSERDKYLSEQNSSNGIND